MTESNSSALSLQDSEIIAAIVRRDPQGLADLYDRYGVPAYSLALHILGDAAAAQESVAAVFAQVWQQPQRFAEAVLQTRVLAATNFNALQAKQQREEQAARKQGISTAPATRPTLIPRGADGRMPGTPLEANFQLRPRNEKDSWGVRKLTPRFDIKP